MSCLWRPPQPAKCRGEGDGCYGRVNVRGSLQALCGIDTHRALLSQPRFQGNKSPSFLPRAQNRVFPFLSFPPPPPVLGPTVWEQLGRRGVSSWCGDQRGGEQSPGCPPCPHPLTSPWTSGVPVRVRWWWEEGSGGSSHALGPCRSVLSPGQGRTKPGLLLRPHRAGCVGRRRAGRGAGKVQAAPLQAAPSSWAAGNAWPHSRQSTPWAGLNPSPGPSPSAQAGCRKARSTTLGGQCRGPAPRGQEAAVSPPAMATAPRRGLVRARGQGEGAGALQQPSSKPSIEAGPYGSPGTQRGGRGRSSSSDGHSQRSPSSFSHPGQENEASRAIRVGSSTSWVSMTTPVSSAAWGTGTPAL